MGHQKVWGWVHGTEGELHSLDAISATERKQHRTQFEPGEPEQFCTPLDGLQDGTTLRVGAYPVAWRVEIVDDDDKHRGFGYVRSDQTFINTLECLPDASF